MNWVKEKVNKVNVGKLGFYVFYIPVLSIKYHTLLINSLQVTHIYFVCFRDIRSYKCAIVFLW